MYHPFLKLSLMQFRKYFWPLLIVTLFLMVIMNLLSSPLTNQEAPLGIVSFELAKDPETSSEIIASWGSYEQLLASFSLGLDFLFMIAYSFILSLGCIWAVVLLREKGLRIALLGLVIAWLQWVAALLDAIENWGLMRNLLFGPFSPWPEIAYWCAVFKFGFIFMAIVWCVIGFPTAYFFPIKK